MLKLDEKDKKRILYLKEKYNLNYVQIAKRFNVSSEYIRRVINGYKKKGGEV